MSVRTGRKGKRVEKTVYLEILRLIAIFGVFFCHTGYDGAHHYMRTDNAVNYWFGIFLFSISQFCVPLFFMITGALLLKREESIGYVYKHRVLKMVAVTSLAVLFQYICNCIRNPNQEFEGKTYFRILFEGGASNQQWFLYAYISLMLCLPFLQRLVKALPDNSWFLVLFLVYEIIADFFPILAYYQKWGSIPVEMAMFPRSIVCCMLGYYLECCSEDAFYKRKNLLIFFGVFILLTIISMHMNHVSIPGNELAEYGGLFAMGYAAFFYVTVRYFCSRWDMPGFLGKIFCFAGGGAFGAYLMEGELQKLFHPIYDYLNTRIQSYPAIFVQILVCVLTGIVIANLLKRIPVVGKLF